MRLLIAICLLAAFVSGVLLAQTSGTITNLGHQQRQVIPLWVSPPLGAQVTISPPPSPIWVADPSAGHYDCPDGWAAYKRSEPRVYGVYAVPAIGHNPKLDKKGHALEEQPSPAICIQEK